jgi:hypothetical protein
MRLVRITWRDSAMQHEQGWHTAPQIENTTPLVTSVGWVMHDEDEFITLAMGRSDQHDLWYNIQTIWKPSVKTMEEL